MVIPLQEIINEEIRKGREEREQKSWYASSLGSCLRGQYIQRLGILSKEFTDRELRVFKCGNIFEKFIVDLLVNRADLKLETQNRLEVKEWDAVGRPDLIVEYNGIKKVYELKSKHSQGFKYLPQESHRMQLWFYLKALNMPEGNLVYVSKDDLRIAEFPVRLDDKELEDSVVREFSALNQAWAQKDITLLDLPLETHWTAKYCSFHEYCKDPDRLLEIKQSEALDYPS